MRKSGLFLCVILVLFLMGCTRQTELYPTVTGGEVLHTNEPIYKNGVYEVNLSASLVQNNSVGNDWETVFTCDGLQITNRKRWTVPLDIVKTVVVDATITERDKWPDIASGSLCVDLVDGFSTSIFITITENKGKYEGNTAEWEITCTVAFIEKIG